MLAFRAVAFVLLLQFLNLVRNVSCNPSASTENGATSLGKCSHHLNRSTNFFKRHFDWNFLKKFFTHWIPFVDGERVRMDFYLYKRAFPECGREMRSDDDEQLKKSGFDAQHQTRIIIHGWMSQSKGKFDRTVKRAYLTLAEKASISAAAANSTNTKKEAIDMFDFNVIVVDWSVASSNVNYFGVVDLVEDLGFLLAEFLRYLHLHAGLHYNDVYLIGHSMGAQIAGSAGKQLYPFKINTIFALDPAGPKFREFDEDHRLDATDAHYVESIQTSSTLGFRYPVGHATFYPNYGSNQKKCYIYGCSHSRAHHFFAESITSEKGFWGTKCHRESEKIWILSDTGNEYRMGGEPATAKEGTFYVRTNAEAPYARGKNSMDYVMGPLEVGAEHDANGSSVILIKNVSLEYKLIN